MSQAMDLSDTDLARSWSRRGTKVKGSHHGDNPLHKPRDPNRDKIVARSKHPRTLEIYRRQDGVFGYQLQLLLSGELPVY